MKHLSIVLSVSFISLLSTFCFGQTAPDFTITDTDGVEHELYADYLDKGITVVLKFFFVNCPPCNGIAPSVQALYEEWGEGEYDVQFIELSTNNSDSDADINGYKNKHSITFPGAGQEGNAVEARSPYMNNQFGTFRGTPSFAVIAPDKSVVYNTGGAGNAGKIENLSAAIKETGAVGNPTNAPQPSIFNISLKDAFGQTDDGVTISIKDADNQAISYPLTNNQLSITSLADDYPGIVNPVLTFSKAGTAIDKVSPLDMLLVRKHILALVPITEDDMLMAADTNADGAITPVDMLIMRKLILNLITEFPIPTYQFIPAELPISLKPGESQDLDIKIIKTGDLNGF